MGGQPCKSFSDCCSGTCSNGACICPNGGEVCNGACVDTQTDQGNCGQCGKICPAGSSQCQGGACWASHCGYVGWSTSCYSLLGQHYYCPTFSTCGGTFGCTCAGGYSPVTCGGAACTASTCDTSKNTDWWCMP